VVPVDFIGFIHSQNPVEMKDEPVSNHDELMSNFFAQVRFGASVLSFYLYPLPSHICTYLYVLCPQPDALAAGKTADELRADKVPESVIPHKVMTGNRPSNVLLLPRLDAYTTGQLLALYEHRTAVQGFVWGVNSFDQMGVELGKVLATKVRQQLIETRKKNAAVQGFNPSTTHLMSRYLSPKL